MVTQLCTVEHLILVAAGAATGGAATPQAEKVSGTGRGGRAKETQPADARPPQQRLDEAKQIIGACETLLVSQPADMSNTSPFGP